MPEPFFLVGPTAVGKTTLAVEAAALCGAEIVSADAFQVYAGLARLSAQPSASDLARVVHHLIGHVPRVETYNVARYLEEATECLRDVARRGPPVIVVGGSGLYVKALTHGLAPLPAAQPALRADLDGVELPELVARLRSLDPVAAGKIDLLNRRRVVRAVEVCLTTGGRFSDHQTLWQQARPPVRGIYLVRDKEDLAQRIDRRSDALLDEGSIEEVRLALASPLSDTAARIIGLREIGSYLRGETSREECLEEVKRETRRYAKRQMTWFRKETFESVLDLSAQGDVQACARLVAARITAARAD